MTRLDCKIKFFYEKEESIRINGELLPKFKCIAEIKGNYVMHDFGKSKKCAKRKVDARLFRTLYPKIFE